jgi:hypothetical protein
MQRLVWSTSPISSRRGAGGAVRWSDLGILWGQSSHFGQGPGVAGGSLVG